MERGNAVMVVSSPPRRKFLLLIAVTAAIAAFGGKLQRGHAAGIGEVFKPVWHTVNDFDLHGKQCSLRRPSVSVACPPFGVYSKDRITNQPLSQAAIEKNCVDAGYSPCKEGTSLFPDGSCGKCPDGFDLDGDGTGDLFCKSNTSEEVKTFDNPFSCLADTAYRPCYAGGLAETDIENYYKGADRQQEDTMIACARDAKLTEHKTTVRIVDDFDYTTDFPLIYQNGDKGALGYLQCQAAPPEAYDFAGAMWTAYYVLFGGGFGFLIFFVIYKMIRQGTATNFQLKVVPGSKEIGGGKNVSDDVKMEQSLLSETAASSVGDAQEAEMVVEEEHTQTGYDDPIFGKIGLSIIYILSILQLIWLLMNILDVYGMMYTLCNASTKSACSPAIYTWREGFACGSKCFFGNNWSAGRMTTWPFYKFPNGGVQSDIIFIVSWHVTTLWFGALIVLKSAVMTFFRVRCDLETASTIEMSKLQEPEIQVATSEGAWEVRFLRMLSRFQENIFGTPMDKMTCTVLIDSSGTRYFDYQCLRYSWSGRSNGFVRAAFTVGDGTQASLKASATGLSTEAAAYRFERVGANAIYVPVQSLLMAIAEEFFNGFYLYQFGCLFVWFAFFYIPMGCAVTSVILLSGAIKVRTKRQNQKKVKSVAESSSEVTALRDGRYCKLLSDDLVPGDVIVISANDEVVADCCLVDGRCVCDESSLTGEPMPVPKIPVENKMKKFDRSVGDLKFSLLAGTTIQSVSPGTSGKTLALVLATGAQTDKGKLVREILFPPPMTFKFDIHWRVVFMMLMVWGVIVFGLCFYMINGLLVSWYYGIFTISQIVSPLVPAVFVISRARAAARMRFEANIFCVNIDRVAVAGKVRMFCFDKTGTLTKGGLDFRGVLAVGSPESGGGRSQFGEIVEKGDVSGMMADALACCHELDGIPIKEISTAEAVTDEAKAESSNPFKSLIAKFKGQNEMEVDADEETEGATAHGGLMLVGNEVDRKMFRASGFDLVDLSSQPVVQNVKSGRRLKVLRRFEFDRGCMAMSCIVEVVETGERYVFTKGSYESLQTMANPESVPQDYSRKTRELAAKGLYVLGLAYKKFDPTLDVTHVERDVLERDMDILGLLMFENLLKSDTPKVIRELKQGSTRPVMITGDNALTAAKVARECNMSEAEEIILGDMVEGELVWKAMGTGEEIHRLDDYKRELETCKYELAVTGAAFNRLSASESDNASKTFDGAASSVSEKDAILRPQKTEMQKLVRYTRIFARMKPHQKVEAVKLHMELGITGMCGDGANDAGALRMAHVGLAISSGASSATIVAPFSTPRESLTAVTRILREGRCALANALAGYKNLMIYGEIMVMISLIQYYMGVILSEPIWITVDIFINIPMSWAIMQARPARVLSKHRPTCKLIGLEVFSSVISLIFLNFMTFIAAIVILYQQDWFVCREYDPNLIDASKWWLKGDNYESSLLGVLALTMWINAPAVVNIGFDYRRKWIRNYWIVLFWLVGLVFCFFMMLTPPSELSCIFRIGCGDRSVLERLNELGTTTYTKTISNAPVGCPCDTQVIESSTCEAEYRNCTADTFNQTYHHNIIPTNFKWTLFGIAIANIVVSFLIEGVVVMGPVRRWLRRRKEGRNQRDIEQLRRTQTVIITAPIAHDHEGRKNTVIVSSAETLIGDESFATVVAVRDAN